MIFLLARSAAARCARLCFVSLGLAVCSAGVAAILPGEGGGFSDTAPTNFDGAGGSDYSGQTNVVCSRITTGTLNVVYAISDNQVNVVRSTDGGVTFGAPVGLGVTGGCYDPTIASNNAGVLVATWHSLGDAGLWVARSTNDGLTWGTPVKLPGFLAGGNYTPRVATDGGNRFVVISESHLLNSSNFDYDLTAHVSIDAGLTWSDRAFLTAGMDGSDFDNDDREPAVAMHGATVVVVWHTYVNTPLDAQTQAGNGYRYFSRSTDGGFTFSAPALLTAGPTVQSAAWPGYNNSLASDGAGRMVVVYATHQLNSAGGVDYDVAAQRSVDDGTTFSGLISLRPGVSATTDTQDERYPVIAYDGASGRLVCALTSTNLPTSTGVTAPGARHVVWTESRDFGATWRRLNIANRDVALGRPSLETFHTNLDVRLNNDWALGTVVFSAAQPGGRARVLRGQPWIEAEPAALNFGNQQLGTSSTRTVALQNIGFKPTAFSGGMVAAGTGPVNFALPYWPALPAPQPAPVPMPADASFVAQVVFAPTGAAGARQSTARLAQGAFVPGPFELELSGTAVGPPAGIADFALYE